MPSLSDREIIELAQQLDRARLDKRERERLTANRPELTLVDAYRIQSEGIQARTKLGEKIIGFKMGLTSEAKRQQMGLHQPIYGVLTDAMRVPHEGSFRVGDRIHPKIEPEIAFVIGTELRGLVTREQVVTACRGVAPAMEILDSRFTGFKYFSLPDVVADNSSSSDFVIGPIRPLTEFPGMSLAELRLTMSMDGKPVATAIASAISGDPLLSVVQLCEILHSQGRSLPADSLVLAGAATQAVPLESNKNVRIELTAGQLGAVSLTAH